jgi:hypothetical protein
MYLIHHFAFSFSKTTLLEITYPIRNSALEQVEVEFQKNEFPATTSLPHVERRNWKSPPLMNVHVIHVTMQMQIQVQFPQTGKK